MKGLIHKVVHTADSILCIALKQENQSTMVKVSIVITFLWMGMAMRGHEAGLQEMFFI